ncbi:MAG TPA: hypothetical protein VJI46_03585 [Candidatus Nanoarchaeia archaeon]|nr:hypothetical protein [Candidatus Nanoarchaeia archaeon]
MAKRKVQIRAPHYGSVIDYNIFGTEEVVWKRIAKDMNEFGKLLPPKTNKDSVDSLKLENGGGIYQLTLVLGYSQLNYDLGKVEVRETIGGLGFNTLQNLIALNSSICEMMDITSQIGLPTDTFDCLKHSNYYINAEVRKSVVIHRHDNSELNLVSKGAKLLGGDYRNKGEIPDARVFTSYPHEEYGGEIIMCLEDKIANPSLEVYLNPGGTQIKEGANKLADILRSTKLAVMSVSEAIIFLNLDFDISGRDYVAGACINALLSRGVKTAVLNDSANGSYSSEGDEVVHLPPFSKGEMGRILGVSHDNVNYSGCGDGVFSAMAYMQCFRPDMPLKQRLLFATAIARIISMIPESNLENVKPEVIIKTLNSL